MKKLKTLDVFAGCGGIALAELYCIIIQRIPDL
jgi:hypothetical protein